jgi:hypothetical protein
VDQITATTRRAGSYQLIRSDSYNFLSCYRNGTGGRYTTYKFKQFLKPFDSTIWSFLLSSGIAITSLLLLVFNCDPHHSAGCNRKVLFLIDRFLRLAMGVFGTLIDNNSAFKLPKILAVRTELRILMLTWLLATIILGNCYKGTVTSKYIAPEAEERLKTFEDATSLQNNLSVYTSISEEMLEYTEAAKLKGLNINISDWNYFKFMERLVYDRRWYRETPRIGNISKFLQIFERLWENLNLDVEISERNLFPKEFLLNCNSSIFVDTSELLSKMMIFHSDINPLSEIYFGEDKFMNVGKYIFTHGIIPAGGDMSIRLRALSHSGLVQKIIADNEYISQRKLSRRYKKKEQPQLANNYNYYNYSSSSFPLKAVTRIYAISLQSDPMQIFIVSAYLFGLSFFAYFLELISSDWMYSKWARIRNWVTYEYNKARYILSYNENCSFCYVKTFLQYNYYGFLHVQVKKHFKSHIRRRNIRTN